MARPSLRPATALLALGLAAAGSSAAERPFRMGFTPFPYDATTAAVDWTYERVLADGDLLVHHLDTGVPWPEVASGEPLPALVEDELADRARRTPEGRVVYLAATPISTFRDGLANYWSNQGPVPPPGAWARRGFNHPQVVKTYVAYCRSLIERFDPEYFAYAIEVDILARNDPAAFRQFERLARKVYRRLKKTYPDLPIFLTFTLGLPEQWEEIRAALEPLLPYTDLLAVSTYPYLFTGYGGNPNRVPDDWFQRIRDVDPAKPIAVAETGYAAETLVFETLGVTIPGRKSWQRTYTRRLLGEAAELEMEFVVWFTVVDYDRLWELLAASGASELFKAWRDTGLYDQNLRRRPAARVWGRYLKRDLRPAGPE